MVPSLTEGVVSTSSSQVEANDGIWHGNVVVCCVVESVDCLIASADCLMLDTCCRCGVSTVWCMTSQANLPAPLSGSKQQQQQQWRAAGWCQLCLPVCQQDRPCCHSSNGRRCFEARQTPAQPAVSAPATLQQGAFGSMLELMSSCRSSFVFEGPAMRSDGSASCFCVSTGWLSRQGCIEVVPFVTVHVPATGLM
jgi:hypothetical protein